MTPLLVGVAGGTGSGKTTIAKALIDSLPEGTGTIIEHDSYYHDHPDLTAMELELLNYDHPDSLDNDFLASHLLALRAGKTVEIPIYDYVTHRRKKQTRTVRPVPVIIVDGILVLTHERIRDALDVKLFVDTDPDIRLMRRIRRDMRERGRTLEQVREQYYHSVRPMHLAFVEPSKRFADLIIPEGGQNPVALERVLSKWLRAATASAYSEV